MNTRVFPATALIYQTLTANGRSDTGTPGQVLDVPDFDAQILGACGWTCIAPSGPTSSRPTTNGSTAPYAAGKGTLFYDTTLGAMIVYDGATWRNPTNGAAV